MAQQGCNAIKATSSAMYLSILTATPSWRPRRVDVHTGAKIHISSKKSQCLQNLHFQKIHSFKISFFPEFTVSKSQFSQNSHFQNLIFHKIRIFKISYLTKVTYMEPYLFIKKP